MNQEQLDWDGWRRPDGSINLYLAGFQWGLSQKALDYLTSVEKLQKINSQQAAAIALATAVSMNGT